MTATSVPKSLIAGDTWAFTLSFGDYPAPTWDATIYFENDAQSFNAAASDSSTDHAFSIPFATTAGYKSGRYKYAVRVTDGTLSYVAAEGWLEVKPNPAATGNRDHRSWARRALDAVEATIEGRATDAQQSMTIRDRSVSRYTLKELLDLRNTLREEVRSEEGQGGGRGRTIGLRFSRG